MTLSQMQTAKCVLLIMSQIYDYSAKEISY